MAEALAALGTDHSFIVHGHDGLDEITTTGPTDVYEVWTGRVEKHLWMPSDFGVKRASEKICAAAMQRKTRKSRGTFWLAQTGRREIS